MGELLLLFYRISMLLNSLHNTHAETHKSTLLLAFFWKALYCKTTVNAETYDWSTCWEYVNSGVLHPKRDSYTTSSKTQETRQRNRKNVRARGGEMCHKTTASECDMVLHSRNYHMCLFAQDLHKTGLVNISSPTKLLTINGCKTWRCRFL